MAEFPVQNGTHMRLRGGDVGVDGVFIFVLFCFKYHGVTLSHKKKSCFLFFTPHEI